MKIPRPLLLTFFLVSASFRGVAQSSPVAPPTTHPTNGDNYREKYEAAVLEVEEANRTLAELLAILAGKEEKSKELNLHSKHLKEVDLPAAQIGLEKSNTQLANLIQERDRHNDAIDSEQWQEWK